MPRTAKPIRIPITNLLLGNDYTGKLYVGSERKAVNLLLDTGSSTLAIEHRSYDPGNDRNAEKTRLVQEVAYGDGSHWVGSVVKTDVSTSGNVADLAGVPVAVAYHETVQMFGKAQGILGLAYKPLDDAIEIDRPTIPPKYSPNDIRAGRRTFVEPYFMQLEEAGLVANKFSFYTRRSVMRAAPREPSASDPLNHGFMILGGGEEATDLYMGTFQEARVLSDDWYSVNLKQVIVGGSAPIAVPAPTRQSDAPTNAIVDSGTNGVDLAPAVFDAILERLAPAQVALLRSRQVSTSRIVLAEWPTLTFVLEGMRGDVRLDVPPENYWQMDAWEAGTAAAALWRADAQQSILGLPLMNGYFTVFDCSANRGLGVVRFAPAKPQPRLEKSRPRARAAATAD
jgi:hypothetical protein